MIPLSSEPSGGKNDEASISKRRIPGSLSSQRASRTTRTSDAPGTGGRRQNDEKVVLAMERVARQAHGGKVEGLWDVPSRAGGERVGARVVAHRIPVATADRRAPGVEPIGSHCRLPDDDRRPQGPVEGPLHADGIDVGAGVESDDLAPRVDAGVGAARRT